MHQHLHGPTACAIVRVPASMHRYNTSVYTFLSLPDAPDNVVIRHSTPTKDMLANTILVGDGVRGGYTTLTPVTAFASTEKLEEYARFEMLQKLATDVTEVSVSRHDAHACDCAFACTHTSDVHERVTTRLHLLQRMR